MFETWSKHNDRKSRADPGSSDLELLCVWGAYFRWRIQTRNFLSGTCSHSRLEHGVENPEPQESFYCFDCSESFLAVGTTHGRVLLFSISKGTRIGELKLGSKIVNKVWIRADNLIIQQDGTLYITNLEDDCIRDQSDHRGIHSLYELYN